MFSLFIYHILLKIATRLQDVCMPVMDGLQATRLIRSFEETGCWDEAVNAGIEPPSPNSVQRKPGKRIPIIAVITLTQSITLFVDDYVS